MRYMDTIRKMVSSSDAKGRWNRTIGFKCSMMGHPLVVMMIPTSGLKPVLDHRLLGKGPLVGA